MIKFHFLYKTTCIVTGKFYYGIHSTTTVNDNYLGSGSILARSIKKYGRKNHTREIVEFFESRELLLEREKALLDAEKLKDPMCMNLMEGGLGGALLGEQNSFFGKHHTPETIKKISDSMKGEKGPCYGRVGELHPMFGTQHSLESRKKMSAQRAGKALSEHQKTRIREGHVKNVLARKARDEEILCLLLQGKTKKEVAHELSIDINVVYGCSKEFKKRSQAF